MASSGLLQIVSLRLDKLGFKVVFGGEADHGIGDLPSFEDEDGGDGADLILASHLAIVIDVDLADLDGVAEFFREFFENGCDRLTRAAPGSPKVDHDWRGTAGYGRIKIGAIEFCDFIGHILSWLVF